MLYGSRAKGNYKPFSDIDIALSGEKLESSILYVIENELDDLMLPYKFDVCLYSHITNPELKEIIISTGIVLFAR